MPGYTRESGNTLDVVGVCVNRIGMHLILMHPFSRPNLFFSVIIAAMSYQAHYHKSYVGLSIHLLTNLTFAGKRPIQQ